MRADPSADLRERWDVVVVGAGPAGSTAARLLAARNLAVLLVDRAEFPRHKVCGSCLNHAALQALNGIGEGQTPRQMGAVPLTSIELAGSGRRVRVPLPRGCVLSRSRLDSGLVANARMAGARFLPSTVAVLGEEGPDHWTVELQHKIEDETRQVRARVVICADGLDGGFLKRHSEYASVIAPKSRIGLGLLAEGAHSGLERGQIRMAVDPVGYVGAVRLEDGRVDVAAAVDRTALRHCGPAEVIHGILARNGCLEGLEIGDSIRGTPALTRRHCVHGGPRLFLLGDAAGYVEPFTGEGIAWAVSSAILAAPLVIRACRQWSPALCREWEELYRRRIGRRQSTIRLLAAILKQPVLSRAVIFVLWGLPWSARPVVTRLNRPVVER